jgi:hypothetical protein
MTPGSFGLTLRFIVHTYKPHGRRFPQKILIWTRIGLSNWLMDAHRRSTRLGHGERFPWARQFYFNHSYTQSNGFSYLNLHLLLHQCSPCALQYAPIPRRTRHTTGAPNGRTRGPPGSTNADLKPSGALYGLDDAAGVRGSSCEDGV